MAKLKIDGKTVVLNEKQADFIDSVISHVMTDKRCEFILYGGRAQGKTFAIDALSTALKSLEGRS